LSIDWEREIATLRSKLLSLESMAVLAHAGKGLAYQTTGTVNWDPIDQTVLGE